MDERDQTEPDTPRVYGPKDWRELNGAPLPALPGGSVMCAAIKEDGETCGNKAVGGTPLCRVHGGTTVSVQEQARRRIDAVRGELFEHLVTSAKQAVEVYTTIMLTGKKDADRLKAADRVLELLGFRDQITNLPGDGPQESDIDKQLKVLLVQVADDRLQRAIIETTAVEGGVSERPDAPDADAAA